jgi:hypothetical protein
MIENHAFQTKTERVLIASTKPARQIGHIGCSRAPNNPNLGSSLCLEVASDNVAAVWERFDHLKTFIPWHNAVGIHRGAFIVMWFLSPVTGEAELQYDLDQRSVLNNIIRKETTGDRDLPHSSHYNGSDVLEIATSL